MRYGKRNAAPVGSRGGGTEAGKPGGISEAEAKRTALFLQAHSAFTPPGLTPMQLERHRRDQLMRLRLGLPMRRPEQEGGE
jgi:hypothetical protein